MGTDPISDALLLARRIKSTQDSDVGAALGRRPAASAPDAATQRIEKSGDEVLAPDTAHSQFPQPPDISQIEVLKARVKELEDRRERERQKVNERVQRYRAKKKGQ